jgi:hypothetical protein
MKAIAFIFVPVARVPDFSERLADCLENVPDWAALVRPTQKHGDNEDAGAFWTWFLPNPLSKREQSQ